MEDKEVPSRTRSESSALHANHLLDLGDDLHQIALVLHHRLDRFVGAGDFIQHAAVFTTLNASGLLHQVFTREGPLSCAARHLASRAVRAGIETLRQATSLHDE